MYVFTINIFTILFARGLVCFVTCFGLWRRVETYPPAGPPGVPPAGPPRPGGGSCSSPPNKLQFPTNSRQRQVQPTHGPTVYIPVILAIYYTSIHPVFLFSSYCCAAVVTQIRGHIAGSPPSSTLRFVPWKAFSSRADLSHFFPRRLAPNCAECTPTMDTICLVFLYDTVSYVCKHRKYLKRIIKYPGS